MTLHITSKNKDDFNRMMQTYTMDITQLLSVKLGFSTDEAYASIMDELKKKCKETTLDVEFLDKNFKKCVKGYHSINSSPINETMWEDIQSTVHSSVGVAIYSKSDGSHLSGMDIDSSIGTFSNKSAKWSKDHKSLDISSYRLTTVCSGTPNEFIDEIHKRKNFDNYSILIRDETNNDTISYDWLIIPSNYLVLDPSSYTWEPTIGKKGKNKGTQIGWNTNEINGSSMSITFSMSSQLWMHIEMTEEIKKFIVASAVAEKKTKYNYIDLLDKLDQV